MAKRQADRDKALLSAVVEIAFDAPSFHVTRLDDPCPGGLNLGKLAPQLDPEPGDLDGETACLDQPAQEPQLPFVGECM